MGDYSGPDWSYSPDWDTYLSESGAWHDPDVLTINVMEGNTEWAGEISLSLFNGSLRSYESMLEFNVLFDGWCIEVPLKIRVPTWSAWLWKHRGHDPKDRKFFEPYFGQNWHVEIERPNYERLIALMDVIADEWSEGDDIVKFEWNEKEAERDSYFRGKPSWQEAGRDTMYFELAGDIRELIAKELENELEFMFQGYPETL